jgi:hypothetical protein
VVGARGAVLVVAAIDGDGGLNGTVLSAGGSPPPT